jgi:PAS domain S-box-containing protein
MSPDSLRILHLEDEPKDAELVEATLESEDIACNITRIETEAAFLHALEQGGFHLILADYTLPSFNGLAALSIAQKTSPDLPFIFVSGTLDEALAIEALKLGATDYVFKTRLSRIAPAVRRAISEGEQKTQRKRAEEALRKNQAYLAEAQRLSQTGSWAWNPETGEINYCSDECRRVLGFDPAAPLPRFEEFLRHIRPDDQAAVRQHFERAIRDKADFEMDYRYDHPAKGARNIRAVGHVVLALSGELVELVGTVIDITDRKRAEDELRQLVDLVPQIIVVLDSDGKWIHVNRGAREYSGLTFEDNQSTDVIRETIHPDDAEEMRVARQRALAGNHPFELEARIRRKDGVYRWFLFRYNPLVEHGRVRRWYASATEIESRKQEEERVRKENVRLEERTRIAQELHDTLLQTFLSASLHLNGALYDLPDDSPVRPQFERILQLMTQGIEEGRNAISGLRSSDAPDSSDDDSSGLAPALSRIKQELEIPPGTDFRVTVIGRPRPLPQPAEEEIYRIAREALVNAFRHSRARRVDCVLEYAGDDVRLRISDNGRGIDPRVLQDGRAGHWGLTGMRERAARIGGALEISSSTAGTEVHLSIPTSVARAQNCSFKAN